MKVSGTDHQCMFTTAKAEPLISAGPTCGDARDQGVDFAHTGVKCSATHRVVLQPFAHLLAVLSKNEAVADQALEGWLPKQRC